jgi:hypothetical protein
MGASGTSPAIARYRIAMAPMIAVWRRLTTTTKIHAEYGGFTPSPDPGTDPTIVATEVANHGTT